MHQVVVAGLAGIRAGTHSTKTRGEVRGGGRKPWRQKGTGRSRQGSIRSPQWVGGGVAHGPTPRDHSQKVNKKMRRGALRSALTDALQSGKLAVVDDLAWDEPKTSQAVGVLDSLELKGRILLVLPRSHGVGRGREILPEPHEREDRLRERPRDLRRAIGGPRAVHRCRDRRPDAGTARIGDGVRDEDGNAGEGAKQSAEEGRGGGVNKSPRDVIVRPIVSEKSYAGIEHNTYTFLVDPRANKTEIKEAVQTIWDVQVVSVNTLKRRGKMKRRGYTRGRRPDEKRAVVTLAQGDSIEIFEGGGS